MIRSRSELVKALEQFTSAFAEENAFTSHFLELLTFPRCYQRDHMPGHITGSAFIVDESRQFALLTHHAKLNRWLQPGGHADGDEDIFRVAHREAVEETGLKNFTFLKPGIFDLDIHAIPARKDLPEHLHYDVRVLLQASRSEEIVITEESHDVKWVALNEVVNLAKNDSLSRMVAKLS